MEMYKQMERWTRSKAMALLATSCLALPMIAGCGGGPSSDYRSGANLPPVDDYAGQRAQSFPGQQPQEKKGMSTGTKMAILAGAAALFYMYQKNKQKRAQGATTEPQYY